LNSKPNDWSHKILGAHQSRRPKPNLAPGISVSDAYDIQSEFVLAQESPIVGFKAAISSAQAQATFEMSEPVFGALLANSEIQSGFELSDMVMPMIEIEMGFQLGASLTRPLSMVDFNQVFMGTSMTIDLAEVAFEGRPSGVDLIASNAAGGRFLKGPIFHCNNPNEVEVELSCEGAVINAGRSGDIGDQRELAIWLVNRALALGYELRSGMHIMTGALGQILPAKPGNYQARYGDHGMVEFRLG
jgi:2-keto-4-pentenoate hydratase